MQSGSVLELLIDEVENGVSNRNIVLLSCVPPLVCLPDCLIHFLSVHQNSPPLTSKLAVRQSQTLILVKSFRQIQIDDGLIIAHADLLHHS